MFVGTVYGRSTIGLPAIGVDDATALALQESADLVTGATRPVPSIACPRGIDVGDALRVDFGPTSVAGWPAHDTLEGSSGPLLDSTGMPTTARVRTVGFTGTQTGGVAENTLGLPAEVSTDTLWVGSFDGHEAALALEGEVVLEGSPRGLVHAHALRVAHRRRQRPRGRLVARYALGEREVDLEVADNADRTAVFDDVVPDASGRVRVRVLVSPDGAGRFGYVGSLSPRTHALSSEHVSVPRAAFHALREEGCEGSPVADEATSALRCPSRGFAVARACGCLVPCARSVARSIRSTCPSVRRRAPEALRGRRRRLRSRARRRHARRAGFDAGVEDAKRHEDARAASASTRASMPATVRSTRASTQVLRRGRGFVAPRLRTDRRDGVVGARGPREASTGPMPSVGGATTGSFVTTEGFTESRPAAA
ncbi:MAG: hypothetical protein H6724_00605 [Sandaracinus sp.]|nr:hypothetical protein [Sandaracinus sp.]